MIDRQLIGLMGITLEASLRSDCWEDLLDGLVRHVGGTGGVIAVADPGHERREAPFMSRFIREHGQEMAELYFRKEDADDTPVIQAIQQSSLNILNSEAEFLGAEKLDDLPPSRFRDFMRDRFGIVHRYGMHLNNFVSCSDVMFLHAAEDFTAAAPARREAVQLLGSFLGKALRLRRVFEALRARFNAALGALDGLKIGAIVLLEDGTVLEANETAGVILALRDGIQLDARRRLTASDSDFDPGLRQAIHEVRRTAVLEGWTAERCLTIRRPSGKPDFLMTLGPLVDSLGELERGLACTIAFITDPAEVTPISIDGLQEVGRLTPAETAVCRGLVNGLAVTEIAEERDVSRETVKSQIKTVMGKLHCSSRLDLVRLAAFTRMPVERPDPCEVKSGSGQWREP